jgi:aminopeptidase N
MPYGVRKAALDGFIEAAASAQGISRLGQVFAADSVAGERLRDPTRWAIVTRLMALGAPAADSMLALQRAQDTTPDGRRRTFIAGAARPTAETKQEYFERYFSDARLNEDWASGSLGAFNALEHEALTRPFLRPALDSLRFIQAHRRIFFLAGWLDAFLSGQTSPEALQIVTGWLGAHPDLPADLRRKVLQYGDELERTVRIRGNRSPRR